MTHIIVFSVLIFSVIFGFNAPKKSAWFIIIITPVLGPGDFYIGASSILPLTMYRISFFILLGILFRSNYAILNGLLENRYVKILTIFALILFILQVKDYPTPTITTLLPTYFIAIVLPFVLIREPKNLEKLIKIFVYQATFISIFIIIEYFTDFSLPAFLRSTARVGSYSIETKGFAEIYRSGFYRVAGLGGQPVFTAYQLVFYFPLTIFFIQKKRKILSYIPFILVIIGLIFLQTRAAIISAVVSIILMLLTYFILFKKNKSLVIKNLLKIFTVLLLSSILLFIFVPTIRNISESLFSGLVQTISGTNHDTDIDVTQKILRIPIAIKMIFSHPVLGYLISPRSAYFELMKTADLPAIFLYLLSGGILFGLFYLYHLFYMYVGTLKIVKTIIVNNLEYSLIVFYSSIALFAGIFVTFSNWVEVHFMLMYILFLSITISNQKLKYFYKRSLKRSTLSKSNQILR